MTAFSDTCADAPLRRRPRRRLAAASLACAGAVSALAAFAPAALGAGPLPPRVATTGASHVLATSALLTALVNPNGIETSYYFKYGPTAAYGAQTVPTSAGSGALSIRVGQSVGGLSPGGTYHVRAVGVNANGQVAEGRDRVFKTRGTALTIEVPKTLTDTYGTPVILSGMLRGQAAAGHRIVLQASPFPYLEPFATIGVPGITNSAGRFSFRVANLLASTQLRVTTLDPLPVYSRLINVGVAVRVTLHVRSSGHRGLYRLYGTIKPAVPHAKVLLQLHKAVRPGTSEISTRWVSQFTTPAKRGGSETQRFSKVVSVRRTGRYRAFVRVPNGALVSGTSSSVVLHAAPGSKAR